MNPWLSGLLGGLLIGLSVGLSASLLLWLNGRVAGNSGAVNGLFDAPRGERGWRIAFLAGLMGGGALAAICLARSRHPRMCRCHPGWSLPDCWSVSARAWATVAPAGMASADWRACPGARLPLC